MTGKVKEPNIKEAILALTVVISVILISIRTVLALEIALVFGCVASAIFALYLGHSWSSIQEGMIKGSKNGIGACFILVFIGMVIGVWILGGTIQTMIYYGLNILTPRTFLPIAFILCALTSSLIGSSFGTIATMGIVFMGISEGFMIPRPVAAGVILAGAMFGDKVSPMSDSTNLTSAMTKTDLFKHVKSMLYVTLPAAIISIVIYYFMGVSYSSSGVMNDTMVGEILDLMKSNFNISLVTLIPPLIVIVLSAMKFPAIPSLFISFLASSIFSVVTQGANLESIIRTASSGFSSQTGNELIDGLLSQGGISSMTGTITIILLGTAMGGILEQSGILKTLLNSLMEKISTPRDLILATLASGYIMIIATGEMMVSIIVPGKTLEPAYEKMNVDNSVLSRSLEISATLGCGILPWGVVSVYAQNILGVGFEYIPYAFLGFIAPAIAIIYSFLGFATFKRSDTPNR